MISAGLISDMTRNECKAVKKSSMSSGEGDCKPSSPNTELKGVLDPLLECRREANLGPVTTLVVGAFVWFRIGVVGAVDVRRGRPTSCVADFRVAFLLRLKGRNMDQSDSNSTESRDEATENSSRVLSRSWSIRRSANLITNTCDRLDLKKQSRIDSPYTELMTSSISSNVPMNSHVRLMALSHRMK